MLLNAKNENIRFNGHDCDYISCPVLVIGADSHGVYEQANDFNSRVLEFLTRQ